MHFLIMKTILITGTNRGLGLELAYQLLAANTNQRLILTCRTRQAFDSGVANLSKRLEKTDLPVEFVATDLLQAESVKEAVNNISKRCI